MRTPKPPKPIWSYGLQIPHDPRAVGVVRAAIRSILGAARLNCIVDTVELLASEIVTNAYRCSPVETYVSIDRGPDDVRVTVWDHARGTLVPRTPSEADERGRGLGIVAACSDDWGVRDYPYGKAVWFSVITKGDLP